ncbi:MAG: radical SAM family heme chaperone HemW [Puniceicoccales bacterium]|jgi:oxygen-independent coproporphyrinogen-3 oxidase|nr:radical SAM family heme chaperone HemW [Puniceicoccales bacterium]
MSLQALSLGLYVHVPFCANFCAYCNFYRESPTKPLVQSYLIEISHELERWKNILLQRSVSTIFFGGGSPSSLSHRNLETLCAHMQPLLPHIAEWTVEVSPTTVNLEKLKVLKEGGVTRISMGVQSFQKDVLRYLGRKQTRVQVYRAYDWIRTTGFNNVNLDLIFHPNFADFKLWEMDLKEAIHLNPEHISTYCLSFERLEGPFRRGQYVDENREALFYLYTWNWLKNHGYQHYEVSNFARDGHACLHNLNTWKMQEWIGLGPSAASQWNKQRFQNANNAHDWLSKGRVHCMNLSEEILCADCLIFGLRMREGICLDTLQKRFPLADVAKYVPLWQQFAQEGLVNIRKNQLTCTDKGLLLVDALAREILNYAADN